MANQSPDRRRILALIANAAAVSQFPGFSRWAFATKHSHAAIANESPRPANYYPLFFTADEFKTVDQLTELIIPRDESPGAHDAGVAEFIDFMVAHDDELQYPFRTGLAWLNAFFTEQFGGDFASGTPAQHEALLRQLLISNHASALTGGVQGREFMALLKKYTVFGYYTSRAGLEALDYPGLKIYAASPECPHHDDPEHKHLGAGRA